MNKQENMFTIVADPDPDQDQIMNPDPFFQQLVGKIKIMFVGKAGPSKKEKLFLHKNLDVLALVFKFVLGSGSPDSSTHCYNSDPFKMTWIRNHFIIIF